MTAAHLLIPQKLGLFLMPQYVFVEIFLARQFYYLLHITVQQVTPIQLKIVHFILGGHGIACMAMSQFPVEIASTLCDTSLAI